MINAANGKALPLLTVITKCLHYMRNVTISYLDIQNAYPNRKIQWIVTIPAIWSPPAKQMMREAAQQVVTSRLTIVSRQAKKKQAVCDELVSYLLVAPL